MLVGLTRQEELATDKQKTQYKCTGDNGRHLEGVETSTR